MSYTSKRSILQTGHYRKVTAAEQAAAQLDEIFAAHKPEQAVVDDGLEGYEECGGRMAPATPAGSGPVTRERKFKCGLCDIELVDSLNCPNGHGMRHLMSYTETSIDTEAAATEARLQSQLIDAHALTGTDDAALLHLAVSPRVAPAMSLKEFMQSCDLAKADSTGLDHVIGSGSLDAAQVSEGRKNDSGKLPYELLPPELLDGTAAVLAFGANKYEARNWEKGMAWGRVFGALMRHMWAWWRGEKCDPETGFSHLWHAACCIAFLMAYEARGVGKDDRP